MDSYNGSIIFNIVGRTTIGMTEETTSGAEQLKPDEMFYYLLGAMILLCFYKVILRYICYESKKKNKNEQLMKIHSF